MDDFNINTLRECTNELCVRLMNIMTPLVIQGVKSIFEESWRICAENKEQTKYLMTFQQLLACIPKWNSTVISTETERIVEKSGCGYLEDLISCVHIIQLKTLTAIRVGNKQKKIDISIPKLENFVHSVYIHVARELYVNTYLFERGVSSLQTQKNMKELETIVHKCILDAVRDSIPTEQIIRAYMDESEEVEETMVMEKLTEEEAAAKKGGSGEAAAAPPAERTVENVPARDAVPIIENRDDAPVVTRVEPDAGDALSLFDSILPNGGGSAAPTEDMNLGMIVSKMDSHAAVAADADTSEDKIRILTDDGGAPPPLLDIEPLDVASAVAAPLPRNDSFDLSNEIINL